MHHLLTFPPLQCSCAVSKAETDSHCSQFRCRVHPFWHVAQHLAWHVSLHWVSVYLNKDKLRNPCVLRISRVSFTPYKYVNLYWNGKFVVGVTDCRPFFVQFFSENSGFAHKSLVRCFQTHYNTASGQRNFLCLFKWMMLMLSVCVCALQ